MRRVITKIEEQRLEIPDGCYKAKDCKIYFKIDGENTYQITMSDYVEFSNFKRKETALELEPISEKEWADLVANLIATIYLSLPIEVKK